MRSTHLARAHQERPVRTCLSCGAGLSRRRRRYCSDTCREKLDAKLNLALGLLNALNVRFATFSFNHSTFDLNLLLENAEVFSFLCERKAGRKPAQDLWELVESLGKLWHCKMKQTGRRYVACRHVLDQAERNSLSPDSLKPSEEREYSV